ncbi:MAG: hypothetical protein OXT67_09180 [Zetaproteobacteria bacterium]|nr:hypothetical protein [Zetaproteobacteria bacterium]
MSNIKLGLHTYNTPLRFCALIWIFCYACQKGDSPSSNPTSKQRTPSPTPEESSTTCVGEACGPNSNPDADLDPATTAILRYRERLSKQKSPVAPRSSQAIDDPYFNKAQPTARKIAIPELNQRGVYPGNSQEEHKFLYLLKSTPFLYTLFTSSQQFETTEELERVQQQAAGSYPRWSYPEPATDQALSFYQPLYINEFIDQVDDLVEFFTLGHLSAPVSSNAPLIKTAAVAINPALDTADDLTFGRYLTEPREYLAVFRKTAPSEMAQILDCQLHYTSTKIIWPVNQQKKCDTLFQGFAQVNFNGGANTNSGFSDLIYKKSFTVWQPCPRKGYKCLGHVVTNGLGNRPLTELDYIHLLQEPGTAQHIEVKAPVFCLPERALAQGKLAPLHKDSKGFEGLSIHRILPADHHGMDDLNLFVAKNNNPAWKKQRECRYQKSDEYYVPSKERVFNLSKKPTEK